MAVTIQEEMGNDPAFPNGVESHVVSMQTDGWSNGHPACSVAVCECGWNATVLWEEHAALDRAINAHWKEQDKCS